MSQSTISQLLTIPDNKLTFLGTRTTAAAVLGSDDNKTDPKDRRRGTSIPRQRRCHQHRHKDAHSRGS